MIIRPETLVIVICMEFVICYKEQFFDVESRPTMSTVGTVTLKEVGRKGYPGPLMKTSWRFHE